MAGVRVGAWAAYARYRELASFPGWFLLDLFIPILIAAVPILLGRSTGGDQAAFYFSQQAGTSNYPGFLLIGANTFLMTLRSFWDIGLWLRKEQQAGTLEVIYITPGGRGPILAGIAAFNLARAALVFLLSFGLGCWLFAINPLQGDLALALAFLCAGVIPLYGLSLLYGALVLRLQETSALVRVAQALLSLSMGIYYPLSVLPPLARALALTVPPAWTTNGMRAALLNTPYLLGSWQADLAVLGVMCFIVPLLAWALFARTERALQSRAGVGQF